MKRTGLAVSLALLLVVCVGDTDGAQEGQRRLVEVRAEHLPGPATWEEAIEASEIVARVRFIQASYRTVPPNDRVITEYVAEVIEYIKGESRRPSKLPVFRLGGVKEEATGPVKYSVRGYPDFSVGEEHIVFLNWVQGVNAYATRGPDLTFRLDNETNRVHTPGRSDLAKAQEGRSIASLLAHLRTTAARLQ